MEHERHQAHHNCEYPPPPPPSVIMQIIIIRSKNKAKKRNKSKVVKVNESAAGRPPDNKVRANIVFVCEFCIQCSSPTRNSGVSGEEEDCKLCK